MYTGMNRSSFRGSNRMGHKKIGRIFMGLRTGDFLDSLKELVVDEKRKGEIKALEEELEKEIENYERLSLKELLKCVFDGKGPVSLEKRVLRVVYLIPIILLREQYYDNGYQEVEFYKVKENIEGGKNEEC